MRHKNKTYIPAQHDYTDVTVPAFGYELLRGVMLPELLGKESPSILYWCGRNLARKYPLETVEAISDFFCDAGWGTLVNADEGKSHLVFELSSGLISKRAHNSTNPFYSLEAGFLAQQIQAIKQRVAESHYTFKKDDKIIFHVEWDHKDRTRPTND
jgi:predicted hydrocarbon binding protein